MGKRTTITYVTAVMNSATTLTALIDPALEALDVGKAGWPTSTPGANPDSAPSVFVEGERESSTQTERAALTRDPATEDHARMVKAIRVADLQLRIAASLAQKWATPALSKTTVAERIAVIDARIWCTNHALHSMKEPRRQGGTLCEFCQGFQQDYNRTAPFEILDFKARGGKLFDARVRQLLRIADDRVKAEKRAAKATNRSA